MFDAQAFSAHGLNWAYEVDAQRNDRNFHMRNGAEGKGMSEGQSLRTKVGEDVVVEGVRRMQREGPDGVPPDGLVKAMPMNGYSCLASVSSCGGDGAPTLPIHPFDVDASLAEELKLGVPELDSDHRHLMAQYQALLCSIENGDKTATFALSFHALIYAARQHFHREESLMKLARYDGYALHLAAHKKLLRDGEDFLVNVITVFSRDDCVAVARFFKHWLTHHVVTHDKKLAQFLLNR